MRKIFLIILLISVYACKHERRDVIALKQSVKKNLFNEGTLALEKLGELLIESVIGGREIATYKLHNPITYLYDNKIIEIHIVSKCILPL